MAFWRKFFPRTAYDIRNEIAFPAGIVIPVAMSLFGQSALQYCVVACEFGMCAQIIAEKEAVSVYCISRQAKIKPRAIGDIVPGKDPSVAIVQIAMEAKSMCLQALRSVEPRIVGRKDGVNIELGFGA